MTPLLQINDVTAGYTSDIDILRNLSLSVAEGSITGLIGLNGAGKSTVMKAVFGFLRPRSGDIAFAGQAIGGWGPHEMAALGLWLIPQNGGLFEQMSVEDNLRLPIETRRAKTGDVTRRDIDERVSEVTRRFPILHEKRRQPATKLSGGQRKLLEFAIAHVQKPKLCLIDEPSIGLSPKVADEVFDLIIELSRGGTSILLVDHNLRKVIQIASYIYVLTLGSVTGEGDSKHFGANLHDQVKDWLGINY